MEPVCYRPIGTIHSPFRDVAGMPIQPPAARGIAGSIVLRDDLAPGLDDIEGFSHLILVYHLHLVREPALRVTPFLDDRERGIFATRAPKRPNPIGLSVVKLLRRSQARLEIEDVDVLDGTPLLDLKPYVPQFDAPDGVRIGWFEERLEKITGARSDGRFR